MFRRFMLALVFLMALAGMARAEPEIFTGLTEGVGAGGYDVVSYATGAPVPGKEEFTAQWKGANWRLSSAENQKAFEAAPEKHAPQYGGYCAFAVAKGSTAEGDPEVWTVIDSKPYLNLSRSVQKLPGFMRGEYSRKLSSHRAT